ncbi:MAG: hypothetical protein ABR976_07345 [Terracidiphilus sp.]|jgi:hypothetical protein
MKIGPVVIAGMIAEIACLPVVGMGQGQAFAGAGLSGGAAEGAMASDAPDSSLYADGTRAINDGRWADAEKAFAKVAAEHGAHADGALYWKAYAENKLGQAKPALDTCAELGRAFPASSWIHECGALEIEMNAKSGKPVEPKAGDDDDLKLLALNALMKKNEAQALAQIQEILNGDSSEKLKKEALFILGDHYSDATYGQIVRVSYVEGDVRVSRGSENVKAGGGEWEKAVADLPLETGFSLVTGAGRAEIELEDASTIYLGENSVLTFNDLSATAGVPYTDLALLTGTVTLHVKPYLRGETVVLKTPTDKLSTSFPNKSYLRVSSYADGTAIAPMEGGGQYTPRLLEGAVAEGQTAFYREGHRIDTAMTSDFASYSAWDKWVAGRVAVRKQAMTEMMAASGLSAPIPGLADMKGQGKFSECAPYGTCWEPNYGADSVKTDEHLDGAQEGFAAGTPQAAQANNTVKKKRTDVEDEAFFPCLPTGLRFGAFRLDPVLGALQLNATLDPNQYPYAWAVCHDGSWIRHGRHYAWVPTHKRHHLPPGRWVKSGKTVAFVPLHPYDVKGRPAINQKEVVFAIDKKNGLTIEPVRLDPERPVEALKEPPREFRNAAFPPLAVAKEPRLVTYSIKDVLESKGAVKTAGIPLKFDSKSQSFMMARQETHGGKTVTVMAPVNNHSGNLQARGGSYGGGGSYHGGGSGAAGSHGGGGGGGGGGGSHGGGGGGGSSSASSSSAASAASSGGSHH